MIRVFFYIIICLFFSSCEGSKNYRDAYIVKDKNQLFIKLIGKRSLKPNTPVDIIEGKTYNDSLIIPITTFKDGVIKGEDVPVQEGYYKYKGDIVITGNNLEVSLLFDNYDDKKLEPSPWNGQYKLVNR